MLESSPVSYTVNRGEILLFKHFIHTVSDTNTGENSYTYRVNHVQLQLSCNVSQTNAYVIFKAISLSQVKLVSYYTINYGIGQSR